MWRPKRWFESVHESGHQGVKYLTRTQEDLAEMLCARLLAERDEAEHREALAPQKGRLRREQRAQRARRDGRGESCVDSGPALVVVIQKRGCSHASYDKSHSLADLIVIASLP